MPLVIRKIAIGVLIASVYYLAARLGLTLAFEQANTSPVWPPSGIAIGALLYFGLGAWPGVFAGALLINLSTGVAVPVAAGVATGNSLEALAAVYFITHTIGADPFSRIAGVNRYLVIVFLATMISASIGVTSITLGGAADWPAFRLLWLTWWLGDLVGVLVVGSLLIAWMQPYRGPLTPACMLEVLALVSVTLFCIALAFSDLLFSRTTTYPLAFIFVPVVIWAAFRFYQHGSTIVVALISLLGLYGSLLGFGPFVRATEFESFLLLQTFMVLISVTGLILAASQHERQRAHGDLKDVQIELENRIDRRTRALQAANMQLEEELRLRAHTADSLRSLLAATALYTDEEFFRSSARDLADIYGVRFAMVGLFGDDSQSRMRTLALWDRDHFVDNIQYSLQGSPCQDVLNMEMQLVAEQVQKLYPDSGILGELGIESYYGMPLVSPDNEHMGLVAVMDDKPMKILPWNRPILGIYANRIALEQARKMADDELKLAASVFNKSDEAILITDQHGTILRVNPAFGRITGYNEKQSIGQNPRLLKSSHHGQAFYQEMWSILQSDGSWQGEMWNRRKNGEVFPVWQTITAVRNTKGEVEQYIGIFSDITEKKLSEERIFHLAHFDVLTNLPNRAAFQNHLEQAIINAGRMQTHLALLFLDLDHFKLINDTSGHPAGDQLLKQVATRIQSLLRSEDIVARLGGDEFTVLLPRVDDGRYAAQVAEKILKSMAQPFSLEQQDVVMTSSIGISTFPDDGLDAATLLKNADAAMYQAKDRGRNNFQFFTAEMNARAQLRLSLESAMRRALKQGEFLLHYQPQLDIHSGRVVGVEALVRWQHPQKGLIPPATFIPIAEDSGLIVPLGEWIMQEACQQHQRWIEAGLPALRMAVNVSARQFTRQRLIAMVRHTLRKSGMNADFLELELTEGIIMEHVDETIETLHALRDMGVCLSIDDFGTGYSSMAYLKRFPLQRLKIDQSFIRDLATDPDDAAIVSATIAMAHNLNLTVIAEGVETEQQLNFLKANGCEEMQGYYFSKPLPAEDITPLIQQGLGLDTLDSAG